MNRLQPFSEIESFATIATDFNLLLSRDDNHDIKTEFPATVERYGSGVAEAIEHLETAKDLMKPGEREQFIVSSGERAVGLCMITNQIDSPAGIDQSWPNISGFVMNPFRGHGIGRFSIEERMKIVRERFDNHAWTLVQNGNSPSEHLVQDVGFEKTDDTVDGWDGYRLYIYHGSS